MNTFIYTLSDPNGNIRYIGKTNCLRKRLYAHIIEARSKKSKSHKNNWLISLLNQNLNPIIDIIDEVPIDEWQFWEKYWISQIKQWGFNLVNLSEGGYNNNYKRSKITKLKMRNSKIGTTLSEEQKKKISESVKLKYKDPNHFKQRFGPKIVLSRNELYQKYIVENLSMPILSKIFNVSETTIFRSLKRYGIEKDKNIWKKQCANDKEHISQHVFQYDMDGNFIKEWNGCSEILNVLGIRAQRVCSGTRKSAGGFVWKYKNDVNI